MEDYMTDQGAMNRLLEIWNQAENDGDGLNGGDAVELIQELLIATGRLDEDGQPTGAGTTSVDVMNYKSLERHLTSLDQRLKSSVRNAERRFEQINQRFDRLHGRIATVDGQVQQMFEGRRAEIGTPYSGRARQSLRLPYPSQAPRGSRIPLRLGEIVVDTRSGAEEVLERMFHLIDKYKSVTVADLRELLGLPTAYLDNKWGWTDLRGAEVQRVRGGYQLELPPAENLDDARNTDQD